MKLTVLLVLLTTCLVACKSETDPARTSTTNPSQPITPLPVINNAMWLRIPMHYRVLLGQAHLWNEVGGNQRLEVSEYAAAGSSILKLSSVASLLPQQLITYRGRDNQYYSAQIQSVNNNALMLTTPLQQDVFLGSNAWNFYEDGSHPNWAGSNAIADYAINAVGWSRLNQGQHVLLGDSWFSRGTIFQRLQQRLPAASISNQGVGGNTAANLLSRFEFDVTWQNPDYVWIMSGTNDYWQDVSAASYQSNVRALIDKIIAIGAVPIVFDASVGPLNYGSDWKTQLSRAYVTALDQLASDN